jgi:hypothetical protein
MTKILLEMVLKGLLTNKLKHHSGLGAIV